MEQGKIKTRKRSKKKEGQKKYKNMYEYHTYSRIVEYL